MTKEEKIKAIYEKIAEGIYDSYSEDETIFPVMIGDVLDYYNKNIKPIEFELDRIRKAVIFTDIDYVQIGSYWTELRKPIEEQSEKCIDYVFNLLPKE